MANIEYIRYKDTVRVRVKNSKEDMVCARLKLVGKNGSDTASKMISCIVFSPQNDFV